MKWFVIMLVMGQQYTINDDAGSPAKRFDTQRACQEFVLSHPDYVRAVRSSAKPVLLCISEGDA